MTFGFSPSGAVLSPPSEDFKHHVILAVNQGDDIPKPFLYNWDSPPSTMYNLCIESFFTADFWAAVEGGLYDLEFIPSRYQRRKRFIKAFRTHLRHIKRMLRLASETYARQLAFTKRCATTSRKSTVRMFICRQVLLLDSG